MVQCSVKDTGSRGPLGIFIGVSSLEGCHFGTKIWPHPTAWAVVLESLSETTRRGRNTAPPVQQTGCLRILLSLQSPADAPFDMTQPLEGQDPAPPISGQRSVPHTGKPEQASEANLTH